MNTDTTFYGLSYDVCFKYVFSNEPILKDFINSFLTYLNLDVSFEFLSLKEQVYMLPKKHIYIGYIGDIVATLSNNTILSLEIYKNKFQEKHYNKSFAYMCRLFDENIENSKTYNVKNIISLNLIYGNYKRNNNNVLNTYEFQNIVTRKVSNNNNFVMYLIRLDLLENIQYTKSNRRFIKWLKLINSKTLDEMYCIGKDDKIMNDAIEFVKKWCDLTPEENLSNFIKGKEKLAYQDGEEKSLIEIAKKMLRKGKPEEEILEFTGLTINQLKNIKDDYDK